MATVRLAKQAQMVSDATAEIAAILIKLREDYGRGYEFNGAEDAAIEGAKALASPKRAKRAA
jgi:hypothetical protein